MSEMNAGEMNDVRLRAYAQEVLAWKERCDTKSTTLQGLLAALAAIPVQSMLASGPPYTVTISHGAFTILRDAIEKAREATA